MRYTFWKVLGLFLVVFSVYGQDVAENQGGLRPSTKQLLAPEAIPKSPGIDIPQQPNQKSSAPDKESIAQNRVTLDHINFEGHTVFSTEELNSLAKPYLHKPVSVDEIEELRRLVTHYYIDKGYITSGATFPTNPIQGKTLRIKIVEGRLSEANIKGTGWLRDSYVKNRLVPDQDAPLNMNTLQDRFRLLLTDPLFDHLNGRLMPGADRGLSILDLEVVRARPYGFTALMDNYRSPSVGAEAVGANGWIRNLTGQGDVLDLTFMSSDPTGGKFLQYSGNWLVPLSDYGTKAYFSFSRSNASIVEESFASLDIKSKSFSVEGGLNQILIDNLQRRLTFGVGVGFKQNETSSLDPGNPYDRSQVSFVRINQEYIERWEKLAVAFRSTFSVGLDSFGATIKTPGVADSDYFAWLGQTQAVWHLPYARSSLVFKGTVQISNDHLLPLEQIAVGGRYSVRGYRENQLVRDNGYTTSAELHFPLLDTDSKAKYRFDVVPFFDYGAAWNNADYSADSQVNTVNTTTQNLYSTGIGFQFQVPHFGGEFFWAHRLENQSERKHGNMQDDGIHFQVRLDAF